MTDVYKPTFGVVCKTCFNRVRDLDRRMVNGEFVGAKEYHRELAHIRDYGVMNGLKADMIRYLFEMAHDCSGYHYTVTAALLAAMETQ
jgi:hypothetical protein